MVLTALKQRLPPETTIYSAAKDTKYSLVQPKILKLYILIGLVIELANSLCFVSCDVTICTVNYLW